MNQGVRQSSDQGDHGRTRQTAANYFLGAPSAAAPFAPSSAPQIPPPM